MQLSIVTRLVDRTSGWRRIPGPVPRSGRPRGYHSAARGCLEGGQAEVEHPGVSVQLDHDIRRLQVPVNDSRLVRVVQTSATTVIVRTAVRTYAFVRRW